MWPLFAVRGVWIAVLFAGMGVFVLWFLLRVIGDLIVWFREEILDDYRQLRKTSQAPRAAGKKNEEDEGLEGSDPEDPA